MTAWNALDGGRTKRWPVGSSSPGVWDGVGRSAVQIARMREGRKDRRQPASASRRGEALALGVAEAVDYRAFDVASYPPN